MAKKIWHYLLAIPTAATYFLWERLNSSIATSAYRSPDAASGHIWEVLYRGGVVRYVQFHEYLIVNSPLVMAPLIILGGIAYYLLRRRE